MTAPIPAASARPAGAAVITGPAPAAGAAAEAIAGAAAEAAGTETAGDEPRDGESLCTSTAFGRSTEPADTDGAGVLADGDTGPLGALTDTPVPAGISEPLWRRRGTAVLSLAPAPPRTAGTETAPESAGESLLGLAASPAPAPEPTGSAAAPPERPPPAVPASDAEVPLGVAEGPRPRGPSARDDGREVDAEPEESGPEESELEPPEPVVSAIAIGIAAVAQPIPNATASAPTRPT